MRLDDYLNILAFQVVCGDTGTSHADTNYAESRAEKEEAAHIRSIQSRLSTVRTVSGTTARTTAGTTIVTTG
jgi:hypothetical protein